VKKQGEHVLVQAVVEIVLEAPHKPVAADIARVDGRAVGLFAGGFVLPFDQEFYRAVLVLLRRKIEKRVLIPPELFPDRFKRTLLFHAAGRRLTYAGIV